MAAAQRRDTAAARTPERASLASAIERRDGLNVRLEEAHAKIAALTQRRFAALGEVNEGEESLAKARALSSIANHPATRNRHSAIGSVRAWL